MCLQVLVPIQYLRLFIYFYNYMQYSISISICILYIHVLDYQSIRVAFVIFCSIQLHPSNATIDIHLRSMSLFVAADERQLRRIGWPPFNSIASSKLGVCLVFQLRKDGDNLMVVMKWPIISFRDIAA